MRDQRGARPPLDGPGLERLALAYAGRFATSRAGLARYLSRKLAERGWADAQPPDLVALSARFVALGYVDDGALAEAKGRSLARRGFGPRRVAVALGALGIAAEDGAAALAAADEGAWDAALRFAERKRFGPFATREADPAERRRATAAMLRAGHAPDVVRRILLAKPGLIPERDAF